jgi:hypothetical protein
LPITGCQRADLASLSAKRSTLRIRLVRIRGPLHTHSAATCLKTSTAGTR